MRSGQGCAIYNENIIFSGLMSNYKGTEPLGSVPIKGGDLVYVLAVIIV